MLALRNSTDTSRQTCTVFMYSLGHDTVRPPNSACFQFSAIKGSPQLATHYSTQHYVRILTSLLQQLIALEKPHSRELLFTTHGVME